MYSIIEMVLKKAIIQVYSQSTPFDFNDFVRGTLRLLNYTLENNLDLKLNIIGSGFEQYVNVTNYNYNTSIYTPKTYYAELDNDLLIKDLNIFLSNSDPIFVISSNVFLERNDIRDKSYIAFELLVTLKPTLYTQARTKVLNNLIYRPVSDNLVYGYNIIYIQREEIKSIPNARDLITLANQIRENINVNSDIIVFSNNTSLSSTLSKYIEINSNFINITDDTIVDIDLEETYLGVEDTIINYIILQKAKKIFRLVNAIPLSGHNIRNSKLDNLIGNLEYTLVPLYYGVYTIAACPSYSKLENTQPGTTDSSGNLQSLLNNPAGLTLDTSGNIYIADTLNHRICKLDTSGNFTTYAGSMIGISGYTNGSNTMARFNNPTSIAMDRSGNLYVADTANHAIRLIRPSTDSSGIKHLSITTIAGNGNTGQVIDSGYGSGNLLNSPKGVAVDIRGTVYISDTGNNRICKISSGGKLVTIAGSKSFYDPLQFLAGYLDGNVNESSFNGPTGIAVDLVGNIFVADTNNSVIRKIKDDQVTTVAGNGFPCFKDGPSREAGFNKPIGLAIDINNDLYVSDTGNNCIRRINKEGNVFQVVGSYDHKPGSNDGLGDVNTLGNVTPYQNRAAFYMPTAIIVSPLNDVYIADTRNNSIRKIITVFSNVINIKPIPIQTIKLIRSHGVSYILSPSLSTPKCHPNTIIQGHQRGKRFN